MRITFKLLFFLMISISSFAQNDATSNETGTSINLNEKELDTSKYAILYLYRPRNPVGGLVGYNIKFDDSTICKLKNNRKFSMRLYKEGIFKIWPANEEKKIDIKVKFGEEYYVKFMMVSGLVGAHPELNLINPEQGRIEYESIEDKKAKDN